MKNSHKFLIWAFVGLFVVANHSVAQAQDDLYYDPATDAPTTPAQSSYNEDYAGNSNVTRTYNDDGYSDEDDYAYEYSSRIRRFHRNSTAVDYYDPFYVDMYNYDPFFAPGASIYVYNYNDYWSWRRWNRWNRWNSWNSWGGGWGGGPGWNSWGWNSCYSYNRPWHNPWVINNYYYDPYWTFNGYNPYFQNNYYGNGWVNNHYYYDNNNGNNGGGGYQPQTYTGPRRNGTQVNPGYARIPDGSGRLTTNQTSVPTIEKSNGRMIRTTSDFEPTSATGREKVATDRSNVPGRTGRTQEGTEAQPNTGRTPNTRGDASTPSGRLEKPATRTDETRPTRRLEETPTRSPRTETPATRGGNNDDAEYVPRRSETTPSRRTEESRPAQRREETRPTRRSEESRPTRESETRSYERPNRSGDDRGNNGSVRQNTPSRSNNSGGSMRSGGSNNSGSSGRSSSGSSGRSSGSSGRGGRN